MYDLTPDIVEPLTLPTARSDLVLRELVSGEDDRSYATAVQANLERLNASGGLMTERYLTPELVRTERFRALSVGATLCGLWDEDSMVGSVKLTPLGNKAEVGYWLDREHTGRGYATMAVQAMTEYARVSFDTVFGTVLRPNIASANVLRRAGFIETGQHLGRLVTEDANEQRPVFSRVRHNLPGQLQVICVYETPGEQAPLPLPS